MNIHDAITTVSEDFSSSEELQAYVRLVEYVYAHHDKITHLSYSFLAQIMQVNRPDILLQATQYFSGERVKLLQMKFELIIGDDVYRLENSDVYEAEVSGELTHPHTGDSIPGYQQYVFPFFVPADEVRNG